MRALASTSDAPGGVGIHLPDLADDRTMRRHLSMPYSAVAVQAEGHPDVVVRNAAHLGWVSGYIPSGTTIKVFEKMGDNCMISSSALGSPPG